MYQLVVCNQQGAILADISKDLAPLTEDKRILQYDDYLSSFGTLKFRVQTKSPVAAKNLFVPYQNHVKLYRFNKLVWAGIITDNPSRNKLYIEVVARTYVWLFTKIPVKTPSTTEERVFKTGTMKDAVTAIFNEGKAISDSPISTYTLGTIDNTKYPWDGKDWTFTDVYKMSFFYNDLFTVLSCFADVTNADFEVTPDKTFNFREKIGTDRKDIVLKYGKGGNVEDYDSPLDGNNYINDSVIMSRNVKGDAVIKSEQSDSASFSVNGRLWGTTSLDEEIAQEMLDSKAKMIFKANGIDSQLSLVLNENALPLGSYQLGDRVTAIIEDGPIRVNQTRRVIGWKVFVTDTMKETATIITNTNIW